MAVVQGPGAGQRFALGQQARIGRSRDNEISLDDGQSSRRHAQVWQTPDGYAVQDMGSTNGTFVNGARIQQPTRLAPGDRLQVGDTVFQVLGPAGGGQACPQCGQPVQPGTRFCGSCGAAGGLRTLSWPKNAIRSGIQLVSPNNPRGLFILSGGFSNGLHLRPEQVLLSKYHQRIRQTLRKKEVANQRVELTVKTPVD